MKTIMRILRFKGVRERRGGERGEERGSEAEREGERGKESTRQRGDRDSVRETECEKRREVGGSGGQRGEEDSPRRSRPSCGWRTCGGAA